jgi:hypothetical protein
MTEEHSREVDIADFIDNNANLFVVLGVFSALAIYISQLQDTPLTQAPLETRVGFAGSLLLALLILSLIYKQLLGKLGNFENLFHAHTRLANLDLILFTTGVGLLIPALANPLIEYQNALYYTLGAAGLVTSVPMVFVVVSKILYIIPETDYIRQVLIAVLGIISLYGAEAVFGFIRSEDVPVGTGEFSLSNPLPVLFDVIGVVALMIQPIAAVAIIFAGVRIFEIYESNKMN